MDELPVIGADIVHLDKNTFMWVQLTHFGEVPEGDSFAIAALIASPGYAHDYASPLHIERQPVGRRVHGRWWLDAIEAANFEPTTAMEAEDRIRSWVNDQDWIDPSYRQPLDVLQRLQPVFDLLRTGNVYALPNPGDDAMHDYGASTGGLGFHEFVVIDRAHGTVHVVVASDD